MHQYSGSSWVQVEHPGTSTVITDHDILPTSSRNISIFRKWRRLPILQKNIFIIFLVLFILILLYMLVGPEPTPRRFIEGMPRPKDYTRKSDSIKTSESKIIQVEQEYVENPKVVQAMKDARHHDKISLREQFQGPTNERQEKVVDAMKHAWFAYKKYAWGADHLKPVSKSLHNWFHLALTMIDSLDTLFIMGMHDEFNEAVDYIVNDLDILPNRYVNFFETTIRALGGLLSAYHLSGDGRILKMAEKLGLSLSAAFDSPSPIPYSDVNLQLKKGKNPSWTGESSLSEVTTVQLEFRDLSRATGNPMFERLATNASWHIHKLGCPDHGGLCPMFISPKTGKFRQGLSVTMGARTDSYYEYLLKQYLQTGKQLQWLLDDYRAAIDSMNKELYRYSEPNKIGFIGELDLSGKYYAKMDHLLCFIAGTLALGNIYALQPDTDMQTAKEVAYVCKKIYNTSATGLGAEIAHFNTVPLVSNKDIWIKPADAHSLLRPEAIEGWWYMFRFTGDTMYQNWGQEALDAINKYAKIQSGGYSSIVNVDKIPVQYKDMQESFFLGETLKYLYLLFENYPQSMLSLDQWVFNTEAHPLPIFNN